MAAYNQSIMPPENAWFKLIQTNTDSGNYTKAMTTPAKGYDNNFLFHITAEVI